MARHRRLKGRKLRKQRRIILASIISITLLMTAGYAAFGTNIEISAKGNLKRDTECVLNNEWTYDYEDNKIYDLPIPCKGTYKLETWGAQGGSYTKTYHGGYGSYSVGEISLARKTILYIVVGGTGTFTTSSNKSIQGGYNGGGSAQGGSDSDQGSGGGATHIALVSGLLSSLEHYKGTLNNEMYISDKIIIVAGGGGGSQNWYNNPTTNYSYSIGGSGGGYHGGDGITTYKLNGSSFYSNGTGGTQTQGGNEGAAKQSWVVPAYLKNGSFGQGGYKEENGFSGGGGGFYGGGHGAEVGAGGGSGYIANLLLKNKHMTCYNCTPTTDTDPEGIKTISTDKVDEKPLEDTAKKGNGYAKITLISIG